jgi:hypothetical protein
MRETKKSCVKLTTGPLAEAEKELAAFERAVKGLFGPEQARQSVDDWIKELDSLDWPTVGKVPDWRQITVAAAARLARRVQYSEFREVAV